MVVRKKKHNRKYLGTRRWGVGNIKNARGKGSRGGVGMAGSRKHKFTYLTAKAPWLIKQHGFSNWKPKKPDEITLWEIDGMIRNSAEQKPTIELKRCKVLSNGTMSRPATIRAHAFSEKAIEKIKKAGGEAVVLQ
jgi:large subunit ribosomal protein L15